MRYMKKKKKKKEKWGSACGWIYMFQFFSWHQFFILSSLQVINFELWNQFQIPIFFVWYCFTFVYSWILFFQSSLQNWEVLKQEGNCSILLKQMLPDDWCNCKVRKLGFHIKMCTFIHCSLSIWCVKLITDRYLRNRKHVLCFYWVTQTRVEVWENEKCCGEHEWQASVSTAFSSFPKLSRVFV